MEKLIAKTEKVYAIFGLFLFAFMCYLMYQYYYNYSYKFGIVRGECFKDTERRIEVEYKVGDKTYTICKKKKYYEKYKQGETVVVRILNNDHSTGWIDFEKTQEEKALRGK